MREYPLPRPTILLTSSPCLTLTHETKQNELQLQGTAHLYHFTPLQASTSSTKDCANYLFHSWEHIPFSYFYLSQEFFLWQSQLFRNILSIGSEFKIPIYQCQISFQSKHALREYNKHNTIYFWNQTIPFLPHDQSSPIIKLTIRTKYQIKDSHRPPTFLYISKITKQYYRAQSMNLVKSSD